jgi:hypothetical protein
LRLDVFPPSRQNPPSPAQPGLLKDKIVTRDDMA